MVKVLHKSGPDFWIEEPLTEHERRRIRAADAAKIARRLATANVDVMKPGLDKAIAADPVPPVTRAERAQFRKDYPLPYHLRCSPQQAAKEDREFWEAMSRTTHITYYQRTGSRGRIHPTNSAT